MLGRLSCRPGVHRQCRPGAQAGWPGRGRMSTRLRPAAAPMRAARRRA